MIIQQMQLTKMKKTCTIKKESEISQEKERNLVNSLSSQIKQQKITIDKLNEMIFSTQSQLNEKEKDLENGKKEIERLEAIENNLKLENSNITEKIRKQYEEIDLLKLENSKLNEVQSSIINEEKFVLGAGKYKGGIDIPVGCYDLELQSGIGNIETNKPDDIYLRMSKNPKEQCDYGWMDKYKNLDISENTILKISESAKVEFSFSRKYDFSFEKEEAKKEIEDATRELEIQKQIIEDEISTMNQEMKILNNELIKKYYDFSDYELITSEECKNKLLLLKQEEKTLREFEEDVIVIKKEGGKCKLPQRTIRQMIRNFNMECDNIMLNIGLKNIDQSRKKIQKSFETLNKLYSIDDVELTKKILELKLEQITLMYTYELKYQQEKDIQKAIKEQMVEEAKAQREIEEQKKKIEKDLQQHLGEVNRLMKYLRKTQIDAEKQLYIDKIKELEDKIKVLEGDKETVLEREANAKAGFVYIISNIGSFGENIYKIGMTRRLEPMDRIRELSSASVPFEFDVHAMIFSSDAPELETMLHRHFADRAVNKVNPRKEFFNVDIDEIEKIVKENYNDTVQFTKIPIATEYRQSMNM